MGFSPQDVDAMSLGQWVAVLNSWRKAHGGGDSVAPPTEDEFEAAVLAARGVM